MTTPADILATYQRHEKRLGGPDMVSEAMRATCDELGLTFVEVYDVVLRSPLMAGNARMG